jgi:gamma-glutamylcyclotransferase (GGCT)/AIG2-like uncharacterized protein YtfP
MGVRHILFYGSLRQGEEAFRRLGLGRALTFLGPANFRGRMHDLGDFPGVVLTPAEGLIRAELWRIVRPLVLAELDAYELFRPHQPEPYDPATGCGSLFVRDVVLVRSVQAFVYAYNGEKGRPPAPVIRAGHWLRRRGGG